MKALHPITSPETAADQRAKLILEAVRQAFAEKGFDGASMQDLAKAAGMSVGNFYRYFPSKAAIVEALIAMDMEDMSRDFEAILGHEQPIEALRATIMSRVSDAHCAADGRLWAEITAASLRKPEIGEAACRMESNIIHYLTTIFARATGVPIEVAVARWSAHAQLVVMLVKACAMHHPGADGADDLRTIVLRTIDKTLSEISPDALKGQF